MRHRLLGWMLALAGPLASACGTAPAPALDAASSTYVGCNGDKRVNVGALPSVVPSDDGQLRLRVLSAEPAVPLAGENTWTLAIETAAGQALAVQGIRADAFMPDHGHPSPVAPVLSQQSDGTWRMSRLQLVMAGVWRLTLTIQQSGQPDKVVVAFVCVAG